MVGMEVLLIQRHPSKPFGRHWAVPAGKLEPGENSLEAMVRELSEEVGIRADPADAVLLNDNMVTTSRQRFRFVTYVVQFNEKPLLVPNNGEVIAADWVDCRVVRKRRVIPHFWDGKSAQRIAEVIEKAEIRC